MPIIYCGNIMYYRLFQLYATVLPAYKAVPYDFFFLNSSLTL